MGTALAFMMSVVALSLPEMIILRKVLKLRLIAMFVGIVALGILLVGFLFNAVLKEKMDGTELTLPTRWLKDANTKLGLGGTVIEVVHRKGGHTPGDSLVWLPQLSNLTYLEMEQE